MALISYLKNVREEMKHVVWPTPRMAVMHTILIVIISAVTAIAIAGLDYAFTSVVNKLISG